MTLDALKDPNVLAIVIIWGLVVLTGITVVIEKIGGGRNRR